MTVKDYMETVKNSIDSLEPQIEIIIKQNKEAILDLNRNSLFEGENNEGKIIGVYKMTAFGSGKGYPKFKGTAFNFYDTGDFFRGFNYIYRNGKLSFYSTSTVSSVLQEKYGSNIFGLESEKQKQLNQIIATDLWEFLRKRLQ